MNNNNNNNNAFPFVPTLRSKVTKSVLNGYNKQHTTIFIALNTNDITAYSLVFDTQDSTISLGDHQGFQCPRIHNETTDAYSLDYHIPPFHHYPLCRNYSVECALSFQHDFWYYSEK